jgi:formylglycine-generating enzyme required for sulfatase activity/calcineurin-like phosphoesterase family protein
VSFDAIGKYEMSDIFISYSKEDRGKAKDVAEALEQRGLSVWWDRNIRIGEKFDTVIEEALDAANCVIVLWSPISVSKEWVRTEATEGDERGILIPVFIADVKKIPLRFRRSQTADLRDWDGKLPHPGFDNLLEAVARILGRPLAVQPGQKTNEVRAVDSEKVNMSKITILHLSDVHFKRNKDDENKTYRKDVRAKMLAKIKEHIDRNNLDLDFVAVTGDIAFSGTEYEEAKSFFDDLKSILPEKTVFLPVPGNHDVDRDYVDAFFSLHGIVRTGKTDRFLENKKIIKDYINDKFKAYRKFSDYLNPALYESKDDYFWVKNFVDKNVSFLGLNSAWASESKEDRHNITLGYPQVIGAFTKSTCSTRILLMHHPLFEWFNEEDFSRYREEILKSCGLILHGHAHSETALLVGTSSSSCINLGANASYTDDKNGFIGFQFIKVESQDGGLSVRASPYILDTREGIAFFPDTRRWEGQKGEPYFDLDTFLSSSPEPGEIVRDLEIPEGYKDWVREFYSTISYDQLAKKGEVLPVQLHEVYIPLETTNPFHKAEMARISKDRGENLKEPAIIDIEALLGREDCILLRGKAGMGKTTLIKHLANTITEGSCRSSLRDYLPVMVFLKDLWLVYNEELKRTKRKITFEPLLKAYLEKIKCPLDLAVISNFLQHNKTLFMFDGLDEIPEEIRDDLVDLIADFRCENKGNRFLITGRPHGIAGKAMEQFGKYLREIEYLDDSKINSFIKRWFRAVSGTATELADMTAEDMMSDIGFHERVSVFTQNPLLLAAVCVLYLVGKRVPEQRADLYDRMVENLLWRRFHDPAEPDKVNKIREFLMLLAFEMQNKNLKTFEVGDGLDVLKKISFQKEDEPEHIYQRRINRLFNEIESNCGLLNRLSGGEIVFTHLTFQEFMAAKHIVYMDLDYSKFLENDWWAKTILLYIGLLSLEMRKKSNDVVEEILNTKQEDEKIKRRLWLLGSNALRDFQPSKREDRIVTLARNRLYKLIESNVSIEERFEAGEIAGTLGDLRITTDNMVLVKGGKFMRGSSEDDADAYDDENPQREIYLDDFMIGKYPVTNEEFKEFVDDGGYDREEFWTKKGWWWREENESSKPKYWHDRKWNGPNFPVVGISWYEAEAYANWLSERTGHQYRLPTEAEWEKAARGTKGLKYPWGDEFNRYLCNSSESGLNRTSPAGISPKGKSPYGCFDMAGNVWEWCSDWYNGEYYEDSYDRNPRGPSNGAVRVDRGGSWLSNAEDCRSAIRGYDGHGRRVRDLGFRLLREL